MFSLFLKNFEEESIRFYVVYSYVVSYTCGNWLVELGTGDGDVGGW